MGAQRERVGTGIETAIGWLSGDTPAAEDRETARLLAAGRLGLVTNPSAVTGELAAAPDALRAAGARVTALFGAEHGVRGDLPDGARVPHGVDARTGIPVWSLYGQGHAPSPEMLENLDALVFDIQDVGARFYTFSSTLSYVMASAAAAGLPVIVLDRPNPLGGAAVEGPILEADHASFVGLHPIPIRHGATMAELGRLWAHFGAGASPLVARCAGWRRHQLWPETGLPWVPPSPAMPTAETALVYPGSCLLEGTNLSEGRGTACPFLWVGAPWIDAEAFADSLNGAGLPGVRFRPVRFYPTASKHAGESCGGCQIHVTDREAFRPVATGAALLCAARRDYPVDFAWRKRAGKYALDRLAGGSSLRTEVDAGRSWQEIAAAWEAGCAEHGRLLDDLRLYA